MADAVSRALVVLNDALARDARAVTELVNLRVECNKDLINHPLIQVGEYEGVAKVGVLGLINGLIGDSPTGSIGAKGTFDPVTGRFLRIREFVDLRVEKVDVIA
ncbi:MAG: hypothetical protein O3A84_13695 [Proteobacteria bacterium]|nr:hypothetical protein [Pseudomonadota bacterium]